MDERLRFIVRLLEGEKMARLCGEFGISRLTVHKIYWRCKTCGFEGLNDLSRRPYRHANKLPDRVERTILGILRPAMWGSRTQRPRFGILVTPFDIVAGYLPDGHRTPEIVGREDAGLKEPDWLTYPNGLRKRSM